MIDFDKWEAMKQAVKEVRQVDDTSDKAAKVNEMMQEIEDIFNNVKAHAPNSMEYAFDYQLEAKDYPSVNIIAPESDKKNLHIFISGDCRLGYAPILSTSINGQHKYSLFDVTAYQVFSGNKNMDGVYDEIIAKKDDIVASFEKCMEKAFEDKLNEIKENGTFDELEEDPSIL